MSLSSCLNALKESLYGYAASEHFWDRFSAVFGVSYKSAAAISLRQQWLAKDFQQLPAIQVVDQAILGTARAVYASETKTIYVSRSFLQFAGETALVRALLEEVGHSVDASIHRQDTPGDEGELFARSVLGLPLSTVDQQRIAAESDQGSIVVEGKVLAVEKADPLVLVVTTGADERDGSAVIGSGLSLRDAILMANQNPASDVEIRLQGGLTYRLRASGFQEDNSLKGDLDIKSRTGSLLIVAPGDAKATIDASTLANGDRVFHVLAGGALSLSNLIITGGKGSISGGGISVVSGGILNVSNSIISGNSAVSSGGGIENWGRATLVNSSVTANRLGSNDNGAGVYNFGAFLAVNSSIDNNNSVGIHNAKEVILVGSTVSGNLGTGIFQLLNASAGLVNTTISGNGRGGIESNSSALNLVNCTVVDNTKNELFGAGGVESRGGVAVLRNTIVAGNQNNEGFVDLRGEFDGDSNNLIGSLEGASGTIGTGSDIVTADPGLTPLQYNGGFTLTHALLPFSPALNGGNNDWVATDDQDLDQDLDTVESIPFDGRGPGYERIRWGVVDIGAFESPSQAEGLPTISLSLPIPLIAEDGGSRLEYTFFRTGSTAEAQVVTFTVGGGARAGSDYAPLPPDGASKTVTMAAGADRVTVSIQPTPDATMEGDETVSLTLAASDSYSVGTPAAVVGTILNDDFLGTPAADTITGTGYADLLDGLAGADVLTGLGGPDRFRFRQTQSSLAAPDRISDFLIGTDKISLLTAAGRPLPTPVGFSRAADNASAKTLAQLANDVFADANGADPGAQSLGANRAAVVVATHSAIAGTYVLVNDGTAALSGSNDILINLRGHLGVLPAPGIIAPSLFFG